MVLAGIGRSLYGRWRMQRVVSILLMVFILTLVGSLLISALVIGGFYAFYMGLLNWGIEPLIAALFTSSTAIVLTLAILAIIRKRIGELRVHLSTPMEEMADSFLNGLFSD